MKKILIIMSLFLITLNAKERLVVLDPASIETLFMLKTLKYLSQRSNLKTYKCRHFFKSFA